METKKKIRSIDLQNTGRGKAKWKGGMPHENDLSLAPAVGATGTPGAVPTETLRRKGDASMKRLLLILCMIGPAGAAAFANVSSTTIAVAARLLPNVSVSTTSLDFGTWIAADKVHQATATVTVQASPGTSYAVTLDAGQHYDGVFWRHIQNNVSQVPYLIVDPSNSFLWGDGGFANTYSTGSAVQGVGSGSPQSFTANAFLFTLFASPESLLGQYTDFITVSVYY
jgi:spore coat protein U-like protein